MEGYEEGEDELYASDAEEEEDSEREERPSDARPQEKKPAGAEPNTPLKRKVIAHTCISDCSTEIAGHVCSGPERGR